MPGDTRAALHTGLLQTLQEKISHSIHQPSYLNRHRFYPIVSSMLPCENRQLFVQRLLNFLIVLFCCMLYQGQCSTAHVYWQDFHLPVVIRVSLCFTTCLFDKTSCIFHLKLMPAKGLLFGTTLFPLW